MGSYIKLCRTTSLSDEDTTVTKVVRPYKGQHIENLNTKKGAVNKI